MKKKKKKVFEIRIDRRVASVVGGEWSQFIFGGSLYATAHIQNFC
jgi:hypothetical protein